ncbi:chromosome-associated kinesin KIF4A-like isoform X2 [Anopheles arabiensis]|uniref:chromosome-associated kinesin KIF4A-like isoform X2 n=1 Tax=Anopheles arabiensis TaxID=7173 RepID=UPI001AAC4BD9|nr:chromosome-associated kinesin KIF4A-like isoform X2 [Anopheles arabiensis]
MSKPTRPSEIKLPQREPTKAPGAAAMPGPESVKVAVRIRPMSQSEQARGCQTVVEQAAPGAPQLLVCGGRTPSDVFSYSYVFPPSTVQSQLYEVAVSPMLHKLFAGYNATILAYGQTSSGKTFTMGTHFAGEVDSSVGVIPRAINDIFRLMADGTAEVATHVDTRVTCSYIEVYQDQVFDLLAEKPAGTERQPVDIREAVGGDIILQGLTEVAAGGVQSAFDCLARGSLGRVVRATAMNNVSSRSHAIFTLTLHHTARDDPAVVTRSKFHLVDLAGSERSKKTDTTGDRFKEGVQINKCLLALGNVITALGSSAGAAGKMHIPYRSSKLTRLLQDSLGGNSYTLMIACVSPADYNLSETYSTLRYANRVCKIKNKPIVNQDPQQARIKQLEAIVQDLRVEVMMLKSGREGCPPTTDKDGTFRVPQPVHSPLVRGLTETQLLRSPRSSEAGSASDPSAGYQKLQEANRCLQKQLQATMHELEVHEERSMLAEKLLEDIEQLLGREAQPGEDGLRQELARLLAAHQDEVYSLGSQSAAYGPPLSRMIRLSTAGAGVDDPLRTEEFERKSEFHTQQQIRIHGELTQLKRELALKEELHRKCQGNSAAVQSYTSRRERELTEQLHEYEGQMRSLESQLAELNALLDNTKASEKRSKLAEERRRKVQQLEAELAEMRQKSARQAKLLKLHEKDAERIAGLSSEIQQMKATRVKLLKTLRTESESFRQWRASREKEITQLKAKDRKQQYQLQKLESTYSMQKRIMQRKMDETIQVNKRLKATLERQQRSKTAAGARDRAAMRGAEAARWVKQELELICNTVEATVTLSVLRAQRAQEVKKIKQMEGQCAELPEGGAEYQRLRQDIQQCQLDLDYRNAQIVDLQTKLHTIDTDSQVAAFGEGLAKLPEARDAFQRLLEQLVQTHTRLIETRFQLVDLQATGDCQEEELAQARAQLEAADQQYREEVVQLEKRYEDKLALLLMQRTGGAAAAAAAATAAPTNGTGAEGEEVEEEAGTGAVHEEAIRRIEQLRDELELYKRSAQMLRRQLDETTKRPVRKRRMPNHLLDPDFDTELDLEFLEDEYYQAGGSDDDNPELDPDFRGTPLHKRKKSMSIREGLLSSTIQSNASTVGRAATGGGSASCSCSGNCGSRRCGCHKQDSLCGASCRCPPTCVNRIGEGDPAAALDVSDGSTVAPVEDTNAAANATVDRPKQAVVDQPDNKENRTDGTFLIPNELTQEQLEDREKLDILEYVAKYRKRRPLLDI